MQFILHDVGMGHDGKAAIVAATKSSGDSAGGDRALAHGLPVKHARMRGVGSPYQGPHQRVSWRALFSQLPLRRRRELSQMQCAVHVCRGEYVRRLAMLSINLCAPLHGVKFMPTIQLTSAIS